MQKYICFRCQHVYDDPQLYCNYCLEGCSVVPIIGDNCNIPKSKTTSAADIFRSKKTGKKISGFEFLGAVPGRFLMLLYGLPGGGKSTFALQFADKISTRKRMLYYSAEEESDSYSIWAKVRENNIDNPNIIVHEPDTNGRNVYDIVEKQKNFLCGNIVIDSISVMKLKERDIEFFKKKARGIKILVCHSTKDNKYKGTSDIGHLVDVVIKVDEGIATPDKNRFGPLESYRIFENAGSTKKRNRRKSKVLALQGQES